MPKEYRDEYNKELEEKRYFISEEICLLTKEDETSKPEDDIYLAINHVVPKELIY